MPGRNSPSGAWMGCAFPACQRQAPVKNLSGGVQASHTTRHAKEGCRGGKELTLWDPDEPHFPGAPETSSGEWGKNLPSRGQTRHIAQHSREEYWGRGTHLAGSERAMLPQHAERSSGGKTGAAHQVWETCALGAGADWPGGSPGSLKEDVERGLVFSTQGKKDGAAGLGRGLHCNRDSAS